jgi:hypothetical protein
VKMKVLEASGPALRNAFVASCMATRTDVPLMACDVSYWLMLAGEKRERVSGGSGEKNAAIGVCGRSASGVFSRQEGGC